MLSWWKVARLPLPDSPDDADTAIDRALHRHGTALVAVTAASNVTGEIWPIAAIARVPRRHGARVAVDAAQLAAHQPISLDSHVDSAGTASWAAGPARHEAGTPNLLGAVSLAAVCAELTTQRWTTLVDQERQLLAELPDGLAAVPGMRELRLFTPEHPRVGIVSFAIEGLDSAQVTRRLADEHGIGVRDGLFCAR